MQGQLFSWGRNNEGQLGRTLAPDEFGCSALPRPVEGLEQQHVRDPDWLAAEPLRTKVAAKTHSYDVCLRMLLLIQHWPAPIKGEQCLPEPGSASQLLPKQIPNDGHCPDGAQAKPIQQFPAPGGVGSALNR